MDREKVNKIEGLENLPDTIEDIDNDPVLKPIVEYTKTAEILAKEEESEIHYMDEKVKELDDFLKDGAYARSRIANAYKNVLDCKNRILFIMTRYTGLADKQIVEVKKIVNKYYITKKEHDRKTKEFPDKIKKLEEEKQKLKEEIKELKKMEPKKTIKDIKNKPTRQENIAELEGVMKDEVPSK